MVVALRPYHGYGDAYTLYVRIGFKVLTSRVSGMRAVKRKSARIRTSSAANAAIDAATGEQLAKRARGAPPSNEPHDDTEMN